MSPDEEARLVAIMMRIAIALPEPDRGEVVKMLDAFVQEATARTSGLPSRIVRQEWGGRERQGSEGESRKGR